MVQPVSFGIVYLSSSLLLHLVRHSVHMTANELNVSFQLTLLHKWWRIYASSRAICRRVEFDECLVCTGIYCIYILNDAYILRACVVRIVTWCIVRIFRCNCKSKSIQSSICSNAGAAVTWNVYGVEKIIKDDKFNFQFLSFKVRNNAFCVALGAEECSRCNRYGWPNEWNVYKFVNELILVLLWSDIVCLAHRLIYTGQSDRCRNGSTNTRIVPVSS